MVVLLLLGFVIVAIHCGDNPVGEPQFNGIGRFFYKKFRGIAFAGAKSLQDEICGILLTWGSADPEPESGDVFGREFPENISKAFLAAGGPGGTPAEFSEREIHVVADNEHVLRVDLKIPHELNDGVTAEVHEGQWFDEQNFCGVLEAFLNFRLKPELGARSIPAGCEFGNDIEADVVPGFCVLLAGISEPDDQLHGRHPALLCLSRIVQFDNDRICGGDELCVFGKSKVAGLDGITNFQSTNPDGNGLGNPVIRAVDLNFFQVLSEGTAVFQPDRLAAEFECDVDGGTTIGIDAKEIQMQNVGGEHIPLHFLHNSLVDSTVELNVDDGRPVSNKLFDDFAADGHRFAGLAKTVEIGRNATGTTNELSAPGTG
jgi:hypothetical protein